MGIGVEQTLKNSERAFFSPLFKRMEYSTNKIADFLEEWDCDAMFRTFLLKHRRLENYGFVTNVGRHISINYRNCRVSGAAPKNFAEQ